MTSFVEKDFDAELLSFLAGWTVFSDFGDVSSFEDKAVVALLVGNSTNNARDIVPSLINAYMKIGPDHLAVVYLSEESDKQHMDDLEATEAERVFESLMPESWLKVKDIEGSLQKSLCQAVGQIITENLFLISGDLKQVISEDAGFIIYKNEEHGFPWTESAIRAADTAKSDALAALRTRQLHTPGLLFLEGVSMFRHPSLHLQAIKTLDIESELKMTEEVVVDEHEEELGLVSREQLLQECDLVGVYFTAQSGGWAAQELTGQLAEMYVNLLAEGKRVEVIFVSSDEDSSTFEEHFETMPWLAVQYNQRDQKRQLAELLGITRVPWLVWVDVRTGEVVSAEGTETVAVGAAYYPWSEDLMAQGRICLEEQALRAHEEAVGRQETILATQQQWRANGHVVLKDYRHHAEVDQYYNVRFADFATMIGEVQLPAGEGMKYYYEVEVVAIEEFAQLGWCTKGFQGCSEYSDDGVGDDDNSWGFDGMRVAKWGNNNNGKSNDDNRDGDRERIGDSDSDSNSDSSLSPFGTPWEEGDVLGLAVDMSGGNADTSASPGAGTTLWLAVNGSYASPNGVAFEGLDVRWLSPALSSQGGAYRVNFGERPFVHTPPGDGYVSVQEAGVVMRAK